MLIFSKQQLSGGVGAVCVTLILTENFKATQAIQGLDRWCENTATT